MTYSLNLMRDEFEALDGGHDRNRRRYDGVAREQRRAGNAKQENRRVHATSKSGLRQRHQRENAALAAIVGAHEEDDIFKSDRKNQSEDQQRYRAYDRLLR